MSMMGLEERYRRITDEVARCCQMSGRNPDEVRIVAVSKTVDTDAVRRAASAGIHDFGENRPDGLVEKSQALPFESWHFIGNIQSRKIPDIVAHAALIHSLYQPHHADHIESAAAALGKVQEVLVEVNVLGEANKGGLPRDEVAALLEHCGGKPHLRVRGLMAMAPQGDLALARSCFEGLALVADAMRQRFAGTPLAQDLHDLSMGMSEDWQEAVVAGATIIRLGRVVFDEGYRLGG